MPIAFVYIEIDHSPESSRKDQPIFTIHYKENHSGCYKMQSPDENFFKGEIEDLRKKRNITLVNKLPPKMNFVEGSIERKPCDLFSLFQASARHKGDK